LKQVKYEKVTIENIENLLKTGFVTDICCDGDNKTININEDELLRVEKAFEELKESFKPVVEAIYEIGKKMCDVFSSIFMNFKKTLNKKITKKKFIKLLQSNGIQRNEINKIIKDNREPYTYARYYETLMRFSKDERKC
jgi:mevalonate kinase